MFNKVNEFLKDPDTIVFILIDEIESLTHARSKCLSGKTLLTLTCHKLIV